MSNVYRILNLALNYLNQLLYTLVADANTDIIININK